MAETVDSLRKQLDEKLGDVATRKDQYWIGLKMYFAGKLSHRELVELVNICLGSSVALHNKLILAIYAKAQDRPKKIPPKRAAPAPIRPPQSGRRHQSGSRSPDPRHKSCGGHDIRR